MNFRFFLAALGLVCAQAIVTASTNFGSNLNQSFGSNGYVEGNFQETQYSGLPDENIDCVVAPTNISKICGNPGPAGAVSVSIPNAPSNPPSGITNYVMVDGDPDWGAPIWTSLTGLTVNASYTVTFYQASSEEDGSNKAYQDSWELYLLPGATTGEYLCPQSYCSGISEQTSGTANYTSPAMANPGGTSTAWEEESYTFKATNTEEVLEFVTNVVGTSGFEPPFLALADVTVSSAVPEPGSGTMALIGIGLLLAGTRHRRPIFPASKRNPR